MQFQPLLPPCSLFWGVTPRCSSKETFPALHPVLSVQQGELGNLKANPNAAQKALAAGLQVLIPHLLPEQAIRAHPQPPNLKYGRVPAGSAQRGKEKQRLRVKTHPVPLEFFVFLFFFPICLSEPG